MSFPFPTYLTIYTIAGIPKEASQVKLVDLTLYEACKALRMLALYGFRYPGSGRGQINDHTHIRCKGRCVSFWSGWHEAVRPMFGANDAERELILTWNFSS